MYWQDVQPTKLTIGKFKGITWNIPPYSMHRLKTGARISVFIVPAYRTQPNSNGAGDVELDVKSGTVPAVLAALRAWCKAHPDAIQHCPRCNGQMLNRSAFPSPYRKENICEACWYDDFKVQAKKIHDEQDAKTAALDAKHKAMGYTHRLDAMIHPQNGGDDYLTTWYSKGELDLSTIHRLLRARKTSNINDFKQVAL